MAKESSFDIVSKVELPEVQNAIQIALKEISTRYDFKGSKSDISLDKEELVLVSDDEFKLSQLKDVLVSKLIKRNVPTKNIDYGKVENASGGTVRQRAKLAFQSLQQFQVQLQDKVQIQFCSRLLIKSNLFSIVCLLSLF